MEHVIDTAVLKDCNAMRWITAKESPSLLYFISEVVFYPVYCLKLATALEFCFGTKSVQSKIKMLQKLSSCFKKHSLSR